MWTQEYSIDIDSSPSEVWAVLGDIANWRLWNDGIESLELHGAVAVGTQFVMTPPGEDPITSTIVEIVEDERISDLTEYNGLQILVRHTVTPVPAGTQVTYRVEVDGQAPASVLAEVGTMVSGDFPAVLANLSAHVRRSA